MKTKTIIIALIFGLFVFLGCDKDSTGPSGDNISIFGIWTGHIDAEPNPYDETFIFTDDGQMFEYYINNQQTEGSFSSIYSITDTTLSLTVKAIWGNINTQVNDQTTVSYSINEDQLIIEGFGSYTKQTTFSSNIAGIWSGHIDAEPNPYDETVAFTDSGQMFEYYINNQQTEGSFSSIYSITDTTLSLTVKAIWGNINTQVNDQTTVSYSINENQLIIEGFGSYTRVY